MYRSYDEAYRRSLEDKEGFWGDAAQGIQWEKKWDRVLDDANKPFYRWFAGGRLNTCYNAIDYHVENGRGDQAAIIYDSPVSGLILRTMVALFRLAFATPSSIDLSSLVRRTR